MFNLISNYLYTYYDEVNYKYFYRDLFPLGSFQSRGEHIFTNSSKNYKYNGIIVEVTNSIKSNGKPKVLRHTLTDDLDILDDIVKRDNFCLMSPISYVGKTRDSSNARDLYALTIDVDGIQIEERNTGQFPYGLANLLHQMENMEILPIPTYIVSSGTGIHLYYVFERPIPLFDNVLDQIEILKRELTRKCWHDSISSLVKSIQYEPVCQGFRIVGTITKKGDRARAFKIGKKVDIEYLNSFVREEYRVKSFVYKTKLTLKQAELKYPKWYKDKIVDKKPKGTWIFHRRVYDKWLSRIKEEATLGHRYWCIWTLAVTAIKCDISKEELDKDAFSLLDILNERTKNKDDYSPFTEDDVMAALEGYDSNYITYPIDKMAYRTNIVINKNKRNGMKQYEHLEIARFIQVLKDRQQGKDWREGNGRKQKKEIVFNWRIKNPKGTKYQCIKETGLTKPTVYKWWDWKEEKLIFSEREVLGLRVKFTKEQFREFCSKVEIVSNEEYESRLFDEYLKTIKK